MKRSTSLRADPPPGLAAWLLGAMLVLVALAGGASFPDTLGQPVVRTGAILLAAVAIGLGLRFDWRRYRGPMLLLAAMILFVALQLVPLPPGLWRALPGRAAFDLSALVPATADAWRPAALVPGAAWNALLSLTVPACVLLLVSATPRAQLAWGVPLLAGLVGLSSAVAALQFAGSAADNPLINERLGFASGLLANRNHQALFLAIGIVTAMHWGAIRPLTRVRAIPAAIGVAWFVLMIVATGSRAGLLLGLVALVAGAVLVFSSLRRSGIRMDGRRALLLGAIAVAGLGAIVAGGIHAGRSESLERLDDAAIGQDMRVRALPVVLDIARAHLPIGAGQGSFPTLFRAAEPESLLKPTYFNRAHDDFVEIAIEGGLAGLALLAVTLLWFARRAVAAWRAEPGREVLRARLASVIVLLVLLASVTDYPARTPLIMALLVLAAGWLALDRLRPSDFTA